MTVSTLKKLTIAAGAITSALAINASAYAQRAVPVDVQNDVNVTSTVKKVPVYCLEAILQPAGAARTPDCYRSDNRQLVTPVPEGYRLAITDVVTNRNALSNPGGAFFVSLTTDGPGPAPKPRFDFSGDPALSPTLHFTSPYVVLLPGETPRLSNGNFANQNGRIVDVYLSGYIAKEEDFARE